MDDAKRTMANQLERFQGLSETRWPLPSGGFCSSGEDRKALSRYINEYIAELEKSDNLLKTRKLPNADPPAAWQAEKSRKTSFDEASNENMSSSLSNDASTSRSASPVPMSRLEYIKRQNELFKELTGFRSWSELSSQQAAQDSRDQPLMTSLELYMAALDEKIYMSADHMRAMVGVRDKEVRDKFDEFKQTGVNMRDLVELRDLYQLLWFEHSNLSHQRDQLEIEMSQLRYDHALQLAKVVRLQYATHALGRKLVDAQRWRTENAELRAQNEQLNRENEQLRAQNEALRVQDASSRQLLCKNECTRSDARGREIEAKIAKLFDLALDLRAGKLYTSVWAAPERFAGELSAKFLDNQENFTDKEKNFTDKEKILGDEKHAAAEKYAEQMRTALSQMSFAEQQQLIAAKPPLELLEHAANLIDLAKLDADRRLSAIIEAFSQQYRAREQELLLQTASLDRERQIILARCEKLEEENAAISSDLAYLEQRTLSLVLMLKSVRATLDQQSSAESSQSTAANEHAPPKPEPEHTDLPTFNPESEEGSPLLTHSGINALSALVGEPLSDQFKRPKPKRRV